MIRQRIIDLLASRAGNLTYPGDEKNKPFPLVLPMYRTDGQTPDAIEGVMTIAKLHMTAIVHLIETEGASTIIGNAELQQLRAAAAANEQLRHRQVGLSCDCGIDFVQTMRVTDFSTSRIKVYGPAFIRAMQQLSPECAVGHRNAS